MQQQEMQGLQKLGETLQREGDLSLQRERAMATRRIDLAESGSEKMLALKSAELDDIRERTAQDLASRDAVISSQHKKLEETVTLKLQYEQVLAEREEEIGKMRRQFTEYESQLTSIRKTVASETALWEQKETDMNSGNSQLQAEIKELANKNEGLTECIKMMTVALEKAEYQIQEQEARGSEVQRYMAAMSERA